MAVSYAEATAPREVVRIKFTPESIQAAWLEMRREQENENALSDYEEYGPDYKDVP